MAKIPTSALGRARRLLMSGARIASREAYGRAKAKLAELHARFPEGTPVPRPDFWGGYRVRVAEWEFWQGRANRMHDRFRYTREGEGWRVERLMP